jgi:hypothetical protein
LVLENNLQRLVAERKVKKDIALSFFFFFFWGGGPWGRDAEDEHWSRQKVEKF